MRDFMRSYVKRHERQVFENEARRQSLEAAKAALDPSSDEAQVMREIVAELADPAFWPEDHRTPSLL